jgi:hypothetical protein
VDHRQVSRAHGGRSRDQFKGRSPLLAVETPRAI